MSLKTPPSNPNISFTVKILTLVSLLVLTFYVRKLIKTNNDTKNTEIQKAVITIE